MPDLLTHTSLAYLVGRGVNIKRYLIIFLVGNVLPDVFTRIPWRVVPNCLQSKTFWFCQPLHTPVGITLGCLLITYFFKEAERKAIFYFLWLGAFFHLFLDLLQRNVVGSYYWFFPFSWNSFQIGLFWAEESLLSIPFLLLAILVIEIRNLSDKKVSFAKTQSPPSKI